MDSLTKRIHDKIAEFEANRINPSYQSEQEQNAILVTLRELKSLTDYEDVSWPTDEQMKELGKIPYRNPDDFPEPHMNE